MTEIVPTTAKPIQWMTCPADSPASGGRCHVRLNSQGQVPIIHDADRPPRCHPAAGERRPVDRAEFMQRYEAMPNLKKAELIEGVVYVPSPVRHRDHGRPHTHLLNWLGHYEAGTPGVEASDNSTMHLNLTNTPQPDCLLFIQPEHGGQVKIDEEGYIVRAPTWSPKSPPAASATTCTTSVTLTGATASANTSSGECSTVRSTGSSCAMADTSLSLPGLTAPCAVRSFPAYGSTRPPSSAATWPPS